MEFTVSTAIEYARSGQIDEWVHMYLTSGDWINLGLANGIRLQPRWWFGPISVNLTDLTRGCGPEAGLEYHVPLTYWNEKITRLTHSLTNIMTVPPLIIEYRSEELSIRDGNHRHEAIRRKGWLKCWVIIWHNSKEDFLSNPYAITVDDPNQR